MSDLLDILTRYRRGLVRVGFTSAVLAFAFSAYSEDTFQSATEAVDRTMYVAQQDERARKAGDITFTELYYLSGPGDDEYQEHWRQMLREARVQDCPDTNASETQDEPIDGMWGSIPPTGCISGIERAADSVATMKASQNEAAHDLKALVIATLGTPLALLGIMVFVFWLSASFTPSGKKS